ncbi:MAG TPA: FHA domain-containing protein [Micromonosporaceae bacterium]
MSEQDQTRYFSGGPSPSRTVATVVITAPEDQAGRSVRVGPTGIVLGRDATCDLVLPSEQVSRLHVAVRRYGKDYRVEDLDSLNGTSLNGRPFTGAVTLHDGDRLNLADVEVEFRLTESRDLPPTRSRPRPGVPWRPEAPTVPTDVVDPNTKGDSKRPLSDALHEVRGFSGMALLLAVAGSLVGTILVGFVGVDTWGSLAGAAIPPMITATFTTKGTVEKGRVRTWAIVILSAVALAITVTGVSAAELVANDRATPGPDNAMTFIDVNPNPSPSPDRDPDPKPSFTRISSRTPPQTTEGPATSAPPIGPLIEVDPTTVDCQTQPLQTTYTCGTVTVWSTGTEDLTISNIEWVENPGGFDVWGCEGQTLPSGQSCEITVSFTPQQAGPQSARLLIHQNLPSPDTGTPVDIVGSGL